MTASGEPGTSDDDHRDSLDAGSPARVGAPLEASETAGDPSPPGRPASRPTRPRGPAEGLLRAFAAVAASRLSQHGHRTQRLRGPPGAPISGLREADHDLALTAPFYPEIFLRAS